MGRHDHPVQSPGPRTAQNKELGSLAPIEDIIRDASNGRMVMLVDEEAGGGDWACLAIPAQMATPDALDFMAGPGKGPMRLCLTPERWKQLGLRAPTDGDDHFDETENFVSIGMKDGCSSRGSSVDRASTISVAIGSARHRDDIVTPGPVRVMMAREGGVLVRTGLGEAAVDIVRLAGLNPSGVICAFRNGDGSHARMTDIMSFAGEYGINIGRVRDLVEFRYRHDRLVEKIADVPFASDYGGDWRLLTYRNKFDKSVVYALVKGKVGSGPPTLVRFHAVSLFEDMMGQPGPGKRSLQRAMLAISKAGSGVIVLTVPPSGARAADLTWRSELGLHANAIGAQILADLDIYDLIMLTKEPEVIAAGDLGAKVVGQQTLSAF